MAPPAPSRLGAPAGGAADGGDIASILSRKLGPLPVWAWVGIAAAGVGGLYYLLVIRKQSTSTAAGAAQATPAISAAPAPTPSSNLGYQPIADITGLPPQPPTPTPATPTSQVTLRQSFASQWGQPGNPPLQGAMAGWDVAEGGIPARTTASNTGGLVLLPYGSSWPIAGPPVSGPGGYEGPQIPANSSPSWTPITGPGGSTLYVNQQDIAGQSTSSGGMGAGPQALRRMAHSRGPVAEALSGGTVEHLAAMPPSQIARQTGLSQVRIASLNGHLKRSDGTYGYREGQPVRLA